MCTWKIGSTLEALLEGMGLEKRSNPHIPKWFRCLENLLLISRDMDKRRSY
jgi:hypothetical protein